MSVLYMLGFPTDLITDHFLFSLDALPQGNFICKSDFSWLPLTVDDTNVQGDLRAPCFHFFQFNWHHLSDATTFFTLNISKFALTFSQPESVLTSNVSYFAEWRDNLFIWTTAYYMGYSCKLCLFMISHSGQHNNDSLTLLILPWDFIFSTNFLIKT